MPFGFVGSVELEIGVGEIVLGLDQALIVRRYVILQRIEHLLKHLGRIGIMAELLMSTRKIVQSRNIGDVVGTTAFGGSFRILCLFKSRNVIAGRVQALKPLLRS